MPIHQGNRIPIEVSTVKTWSPHTFVLLAAALLAPSHGTAVGLGEINVQSFLGEPFRATIALQTTENEEVDVACLSLAPPPQTEGMVYLRRARLSLSEQGGVRQLLVSGIHALDEPYLNVVIQSSCETQGRMLREYTVLIDPPTYAPAAYTPPPQTEPERQATDDTAPAKPSQAKIVARSGPAGTPGARKTAKRVHEAGEQKTVRRAPAKRDQLKVVSGVGESPLKAEQTEKERLQQREKDLMKELDDKTAQYLAMQSQLEKLEVKLTEMQKTIALQNKIMASMQQTSAPARKPDFNWKDYWLAGPFVLVAGLGYFLARRSRKQSLDDWKPTVRDIGTGK